MTRNIVRRRGFVCLFNFVTFLLISTFSLSKKKETLAKERRKACDNLKKEKTKIERMRGERDGIDEKYKILSTRGSHTSYTYL